MYYGLSQYCGSFFIWRKNCHDNLVFPDLMLPWVKGSKQIWEAGFLPLLPLTRWSSPRPKAASRPEKQDFAASAEDLMKLTKTKGSKQTREAEFLLPLPLTRWSSPRPKAAIFTSEAGFCCLRRRPDEAHQDQRQQVDLRSRIFAASAVDPMKITRIKGNKSGSEASNLLPSPQTWWISLWQYCMLWSNCGVWDLCAKV